MTNFQHKGQGHCNKEIEETYNPKVKDTVAWERKNLQPEFEGHWYKAIEDLTNRCNKAIEELPTESSRTLHGNWRNNNPKFKETVKRQYNKYNPKVQKHVTMQLKSLQRKYQWNCNKATKELTTQSVKKTLTMQLKNLQPEMPSEL